jgi:hypothetical protein
LQPAELGAAYKLLASDGTASGPFGIGQNPTGILPDELGKLERAFRATLTVVPLAGPRAMAFDGTYRWVTNNLSPGPGELVVRASDGAVVASLPLPATPFGVAYDGLHVWVTVEANPSLVRIRANDGLTVGSFGVPGVPSSSRSMGLTSGRSASRTSR